MTHASTQGVLKQAERHCGERGSRLTKKRRQVLAGLLESERALSAYELLDICRKNQGVDLLPTSVYRILEFLEGEDLVHRLNLVNKYVACSHISCDHEHEVPQFLICKSCHRVQEIGISRSLITSIAQAIETAEFQLASNQLELNCVCNQCATELDTDA
jgi:Fur family zinc uptake transcriptional regulator